MRSNRLLSLSFLLCCRTLNAQSYGVLAGGSGTDLYAAATVFQPGKGLSLGVFMPFYMNDRFVIRAEAGAASFTQRVPVAESSMRSQRTEASVTALCRYYLNRKTSLSLGIQGIRLLQEPETLVFGQSTCVLRRTGACLLMGAAFRWTDRIETGLRYGQGVLVETELPTYGPARRRYAHVMMSYLLHSARPVFAERRKWRSGLALAHRY